MQERDLLARIHGCSRPLQHRLVQRRIPGLTDPESHRPQRFLDPRVEWHGDENSREFYRIGLRTAGDGTGKYRIVARARCKPRQQGEGSTLVRTRHVAECQRKVPEHARRRRVDQMLALRKQHSIAPTEFGGDKLQGQTQQTCVRRMQGAAQIVAPQFAQTVQGGERMQGPRHRARLQQCAQWQHGANVLLLDQALLGAIAHEAIGRRQLGDQSCGIDNRRRDLSYPRSIGIDDAPDATKTDRALETAIALIAFLITA